MRPRAWMALAGLLCFGCAEEATVEAEHSASAASDERAGETTAAGEAEGGSGETAAGADAGGAEPEVSAHYAANEACREADPHASVAHLVAASVVRASISLGESGERWNAALNQLAAAQSACLAAASRKATPPTAPARALRAALLRDVALPRQDRGGMPQLPWRLLEDGSLRAARELPGVDAALEEGRVADAHAGLVAAQRARLRDLPEVLRFLDEPTRAALLDDAAWIGWLGVAR